MSKKLFLGLTGSVASIKYLDLISQSKKNNFEVIWHSTKSGKPFVLSALSYKLKKLLEEDKDNSEIGEYKEIVDLLCKESTKKNVLLKPIFDEFNRLSKTIISSKNELLINLINYSCQTYEEGIDYDGVVSKEKGHVKHINIANAVDIALIAPTSANTLSKVVNGITDNFLLEVIRAIPNDKKCYLALAMNTNMLQDYFIAKNIDIIKSGIPKYKIIDPIYKILQCGVEGDGAMETPEKIFEIIKDSY